VQRKNLYLERVSLILEIVGQSGEASVTDICDNSDLPKPSVYRLVQDLVGTGLLEPVVKGRFAIGTRLRRMTHNDQSDSVLRDIIGPKLKAAAAQYGTAFFLSRLRGYAVEIIHVETPDNGISYLHPGLGKRPLHACSCSKAVAAFSPDIIKLQDLQGRLKAYTEFTLTRIEDLEAEFKTIRSRGYAECVEEIERGMCSVAAPLTENGLGATISIGTTGSMRVLTSSFRAKIGKAIKDIASEISANFTPVIPQPHPYARL